MFGYFKGKKLPASNFLENTIAREFDVPKEQAGICAAVFIKNSQFIGLARRPRPASGWETSRPGCPMALPKTKETRRTNASATMRLTRRLRETRRPSSASSRRAKTRQG